MQRHVQRTHKHIQFVFVRSVLSDRRTRRDIPNKRTKLNGVSARGVLDKGPVESNGLGGGEHVVGLGARVGRSSNGGNDAVYIYGD